MASVGRPRDRLMSQLVERYLERAARLAPLRCLTVPAARGGDESRRRREEAAALAGQAAGRESVLLTIRGESWDTARLALFIGRRLSASSDTIFCVGGELGFAPQDEAWADQRIALSAMTLPHELARVVVAEQIYRALTIVRRIKYHK